MLTQFFFSQFPLTLFSVNTTPFPVIHLKLTQPQETITTMNCNCMCTFPQIALDQFLQGIWGNKYLCLFKHYPRRMTPRWISLDVILSWSSKLSIQGKVIKSSGIWTGCGKDYPGVISHSLRIWIGLESKCGR